MNKLTVLDNGTRVVTETISEFRSCTIGAWVSTGSRYESEADAGLSVSAMAQIGTRILRCFIVGLLYPVPEESRPWVFKSRQL